MTKKTLISLAIFTLSAFVLTACAGVGPYGDKTAAGSLKIGFVGALTGDAAAYGDPSQKGVQLAVEELNAAGGIKGRQLVVIYEDAKCNGRDATTALQKLINVDQVKIVIGGSCSGETLPMAPIAENNQLLLFSPLATSPRITNAGDFIFRNAPSDALAGDALAKGAYNTFKYKKVALISENTDYAQGLREVFSKKFKELGGEIVADENYNPELTDFRAQLVKIKQTKPKALLINSQGPQTGSLIAIQARELALNVPILTNEVLGSTAGIKHAGDAVNGMVWAQPALDEESSPVTKQFLAAYRAKYNEEPSYPFYAATSYDAKN